MCQGRIESSPLSPRNVFVIDIDVVRVQQLKGREMGHDFPSLSSFPSSLPPFLLTWQQPVMSPSGPFLHTFYLVEGKAEDEVGGKKWEGSIQCPYHIAGQIQMREVWKKRG